MPLRTHGEFLAFDTEDDVIYVPVNRADGGDILAEVRQISLCFNVGYVCRDDDCNLSRFDGQVFIWGHGNKTAKGVYTSDGRALAKQIVDDLIAKRLPNNSKVVLWSCFSGNTGGMAQSLWLTFEGSTRTGIRVYAPKYATGSMTNFKGERDVTGLMIYGTNRGLAKGGVLIPSNTMNWHGSPSLAKPEDMVAINSRAGMVAAEV